MSRSVEVVHRLPASTSDAAQAVAAGAADLALCNDLGRAEAELAWVTKRAGTDSLDALLPQERVGAARLGRLTAWKRARNLKT
jgi:hypothetical protein